MQIHSIETERQAFSIQAFCYRNGISACTYHRLKQKGLTPREMRVGNAIRISIEAERDWRAAREMPDDTEARLLKREAEARSRKAKKAIKTTFAKGNHISQRRKAVTAAKAGR